MDRPQDVHDVYSICKLWLSRALRALYPTQPMYVTVKEYQLAGICCTDTHFFLSAKRLIKHDTSKAKIEEFGILGSATMKSGNNFRMFRRKRLPSSSGEYSFLASILKLEAIGSIIFHQPTGFKYQETQYIRETSQENPKPNQPINSMELCSSWEVNGTSDSQTILAFFKSRMCTPFFIKAIICPYPQPDEYSPRYPILFMWRIF